MPININNSLPSIHFPLRENMDDDNCMQMLVDTGAAMNSGHLNYHLWVMSQCPELVAKFLQCGEGTEYVVV